MRFAFDDDVTALRDEARRFLAARSTSAEIRSAMEGEAGVDPALWAALCDLGWPALVVPEAEGGVGLSWTALGGLLEETGGALLCAPLLSTVALGQAPLLVAGDDDQRARWLPSLASGETTATLALAEAGGGWDPDRVTTTARREGDDWILDGVKTYVPDGGAADLLIVAARAGRSVGLFVVPAQSEGVGVRPLPTMDLTRKQAEVRLRGVRVPASDALRAGPEDLGRVLDLAGAALAAEQAGGARACLDMAVEYAKVREQFGRPIGSFQAVQHMCADMLVRVESARSAAWHACWAAAEDPDALPRAAAAAQVCCSEAYLHCAGQNIQIHGGVGFTWEHDAHLHFKRARSTMSLLGDARAWRRRYADRAGL